MQTYPQRSTRWTVSYRHRCGGGETTSTHLDSTSAVRQRHAFAAERDWLTGVRITEHITTETRTPIAMDDLPGDHEPTLPPDLPEGAHQVVRHFRFDNAGPAVLRTGDDIRHYRTWIAEQHHRPSAPYWHFDLSTLVVLDVVLVRYARDITLAELPPDLH
ncbi:MAG: hypothetical protein QOF44_1053 [Streptomyces sp.]|nr:hypothetical protein [Streptomyces sp.]